MSERTAIYRLFAADDTLLYIGIAKRFGTRWEQHARVQPWWPHVEHQTVRWLPSREDARLAEDVAIKAERPVYNIAGSPWEGGVKDDGTGFWVRPKPPRVPKPRDPNAVIDETPIQRFRMPLEAWLAFGHICRRQRIPRARVLFDLMWADVRRHGTDEEKVAFIAADTELHQRRSRRRAHA